MINQLCMDVGDQLKRLEFPIDCHYAPERTGREGYGDCVLFSRDRELGDLISPAYAAHGRWPSDQRAAWMQGAKIEVYTQSPVSGARVSDHEEACDHFVEAVVCAVGDWCSRNNMGKPEFSESRYVPPNERSEEEQWPGVVYRMRLRIGRGIYRRRFERPLPDTAEIKNVETSLVAESEY